MLRNKLGKVNSHEFQELHRTWHPVLAPSQCFEFSPLHGALKQCVLSQGKLGTNLTKPRLHQGWLKCREKERIRAMTREGYLSRTSSQTALSNVCHVKSSGSIGGSALTQALWLLGGFVQSLELDS